MLFQSKVKEESLLVKVTAVVGETIDSQELTRFNQARLKGFLRPTQISPAVIGYKGAAAVSLAERLVRPVTKQDFLMILEQIVMAFRSLQIHSLPVHYLMMDLHEVYIQEKTRDLQFLYLPMKNTQVHPNMIGFLEEFARSVRPMPESDMAYAQRFLYFFRNLQPISIDKIEDFVLREDPSVIQYYQGRPATTL